MPHLFLFFWKIPSIPLFLLLDGIRQFLIKSRSPGSPAESAEAVAGSAAPHCGPTDSKSLGTSLGICFLKYHAHSSVLCTGVGPAGAPRGEQRTVRGRQGVFRAGWHHRDEMTEARRAQADKKCRRSRNGRCACLPSEQGRSIECFIPKTQPLGYSSLWVCWGCHNKGLQDWLA